MGDILKETGDIKLKQLLDKYNLRGYMYVEFPHKDIWSKEFKDDNYRKALKHLFAYKKNVPLLLYVHIPFCPKQCLFCICYSKVTGNYERVKRYLAYLFREIDLLKEYFDKNRIMPNFTDIHLGGGSPTILKEKEFDLLVSKIGTIADMKKIQEFTIEIDPRAVTNNTLLYYHAKGINRISLGIQDIDLDVQRAVNRVQPPELIESLLVPETRKLFNSVNFDILCGLPKQTRETFRRTVATVIKLSPDRICDVFVTYAPSYRKHQRLIAKLEMPDTYEKTVMFHESAQSFLNNGYVRIGFDHFAKPTDILAKSMMNRSIHWNGLGYRAGDIIDIIGIGASSACRLGSYYYSQNYYEFPLYEGALDNAEFPIYRGYKMNDSDIIRRDIIHTLRSYFFISRHEIEKKYNIEFREYFNQEEKILHEFAKDKLIENAGDRMAITDLGIHFIYQICRIWDNYLPPFASK